MFAGAQIQLIREETQRYEGGIPVNVNIEQFNFEINAKREYLKFVYTMFFRLVLESQQGIYGRYRNFPYISYPTYAQPPPLSISSIRIMLLLQFMNLQ